LEEEAVKLTELEQRVRSNTRRIEGLERGQEMLNRLATAVEVLATKQSSTGRSVEELKLKIDAMESRPRKRWESVLDRLAVAVMSLLIGWLLAQMGVAA
jgi:hypothetical protein